MTAPSRYAAVLATAVLVATLSGAAVVCSGPAVASAGPLPDSAAGGTAETGSAQLAVSAAVGPHCGTLPAKGAKAGDEVAVSAALGPVLATLSGTAAGPPIAGWQQWRHMTLALSVRGETTASARVRLPPEFGGTVAQQNNYAPFLTPIGSGPLCVAEFLGPPAETAVLVGLSSGGAHCCTWVEAFVVSGKRLVTPPIEQDIGNPSAQVATVDGRTALITADNAFAYTFAAYAFSGMPVRVLELQGTRFVNVTKYHLGLVATDAARWWTAFEDAPAEVRQVGGQLGLLAPWAADECLLGKAAQAWATVDKLAREGRLDNGSASSGWSGGEGYVRTLHTFLVNHGYCSPAESK